MPIDPEYVELNMSNYDEDQVCQLNGYGVWAVGEIDTLREALRLALRDLETATNLFDLEYSSVPIIKKALGHE